MWFAILEVTSKVALTLPMSSTFFFHVFSFPLTLGSDLWIVMEYCGGGSVSDIMRLRKKTLTEDEISAILKDTLMGLEYLHQRRKIHRDIKAGNILLNNEGHAKLGNRTAQQ